ncbi:hypothetical protein A1O7_09871 [Cladophialophora yegresii CBS 114405]|uniref:Uncharacterized protein n=1 Tax=Cladophialophora yegresii CBS 114405 TaxID=1182544 RepID=W9VQU5_9EURO|nr:uncharacterized protein A1O7_09871 [Cladophialophora yegresii CBS 114405]EXJ54531.1 hypothetical protein A1O7_09871 [Cladophialophora yegresii CBS 114405]
MAEEAIPLQPFKEARSPRDKSPSLTPDWKPRNGLLQFIRHNQTIPIALCVGFLSASTAISFTWWLSGEKLQCPGWASDCSIPPQVKWLRDNIGTVQGLVTFVYATSLAAMAYAAHAWSEASIWPLLAQRPYSIEQIETFLSASRGSVPSTAVVFRHVANFDAALVIICTALITLIPLTAAPLVGFVFHQQIAPLQARSNYTGGGGTGRHFLQYNPPVSLLAPAVVRYASWAEPLAEEPMQDYRDWFVDRYKLADKGNLAACAVRLQKAVTCRGHQVDDVHEGKVSTRMHNRTFDDGQNPIPRGDKTVDLLMRPQLAVWADDCHLPSSSRARSRLVFASLNGTIENGITAYVKHDEIHSLEAVACDIDIELVDDILCIGDEGCREKHSINQTLTSLQDIYRKNSLNEIVLWMAMAPILVGVSVSGKQPMFYHWGMAPLPHLYTTTIGKGDHWTLEQLEHFINVSISAVVQELVVNQPAEHDVEIISLTTTTKLESDRVRLLILPVATMLIVMALLVSWSELLHRKYKIPLRRLASLSEFLKSCQTAYVAKKAAADSLQADRPSQLGKLKVMFGRWTGLDTDESLIAGLGNQVESFSSSRPSRHAASTSSQEVAT